MYFSPLLSMIICSNLMQMEILISSSVQTTMSGPKHHALPVRFGGLGIQSAIQLAPSASLASATGSSELVNDIIPSHLKNIPALPNLEDRMAMWSQDHVLSPPEGTAQVLQ